MKNKKINILAVFVKTMYLILIILLFYVVGVLVQINENRGDKEDNISKTEVVDSGDEVIFTSYFPGCNLLNSKCLDMECDSYDLCSDKKYLVCEIYDCGEEWGIGTKDKDGKTNIQRKIKDNKKKIIEVKGRCNGTVEILESNCVNERLEIETRVITDGNCKIEGFWIGYEEKGSSKPAKFSSLGNGLYLVVTNNCEKISEIIAMGENGISIK